MSVPDERRSSSVGQRDRVFSAPSPSITFEPRHSVRAVGRTVFRTQAVRDMACLLDVEPELLSWRTAVAPITLGGISIAADLDVLYPSRRELLVVGDGAGSLSRDQVRLATSAGYVVKTIELGDIEGVRLENAKALLRYARWTVSLSDRVRLLATLEEEGSLPLAACMSAIRSGRDSIAVIAALCLHRFVELDLDSGRIGPQTRVTPFRG